MKKERIILSVFLIAMVALAWYSQITLNVNQTQKYDELIESAESYVEQKLFQKAIFDYEDALKIKESESVREKWMDAYLSALDDGVIKQKDYIKAMEEFCTIYPKRTDVWEKIISQLIDSKSYKDAKKYYNKAVQAGAKSEKLDDLGDIIEYSFSENKRIYTKVIGSSNGYHTVFNDKKWGVMGSDGEWIYECDYLHIGPSGNTDEFLVTTDKGLRVLDKSSVVQAIIEEEFKDSKMISDSIIPVYDGKAWRYYDYSENKYILDSYENVSSFCDGNAYIKKDGKWYLINKSGEVTDGVSFDNIIMLDNGEFSYKNIMIASNDGKCDIYNSDGKKLSDIGASDMDFYFGDLIAFKDGNGKWGFVDKDGNIKIEAQFDEAKSFSGGLAAVKKDEKWGFINKTGKLVIENRFVDTGYFTSKGICFVSDSTGEFHMIALRFKGGK